MNTSPPHFRPNVHDAVTHVAVIRTFRLTRKDVPSPFRTRFPTNTTLATCFRESRKTRTGSVNSESKYVSQAYDTTQNNGYYEYFDDQLNRPTTLGMDVRYEYEGISVPIKTVHQPTGATLDYTPSDVRDRFGRILEQAGVTLDENYTYDQQNQLIDLNRPGNHEHFHYDSTGNWLNYEQNNTNQTRVHNTANELISINDQPVTTDASGNMMRIPNLNLTYDAWNRLVRVTSTDGTIVSAYTYDGLNRCVSKTNSAETREYYYNRNWQCLEEYSNGTLQNSYLWGIRYLDDLICFTPDYTIALTDANFNVVAVANQSGITERYTYTAFGTRTILTPSYDPRSATLYPVLTRTFTSQVFDAETGLMLYRNRFYSPTLGRFITRDPIGYKGMDENLYRYVKNQANLSRDFSGLFYLACKCFWYVIWGHDVYYEVKEVDCRSNTKKCCTDVCEENSSWSIPHHWTEESSRHQGKVERCCRPTEINCMVDTAIMLVGQRHCWLRTSQKEVGLGGQGNRAPEEVGSSPTDTQTELTDHSGQGNRDVSMCTSVLGCDEDCVNKELTIGKPMGEWTLTNNCNTVADEILRKCHCLF